MKIISFSCFSIKTMSNTYHLILFILIINVLLVFVLPLVNCEDEQTKMDSIDKIIKSKTMESFLHDSEDKDREIMEYFLEHLFRSYPQRRASSFHAMRGKRFLRQPI